MVVLFLNHDFDDGFRTTPLHYSNCAIFGLGSIRFEEIDLTRLVGRRLGDYRAEETKFERHSKGRGINLGRVLQGGQVPCRQPKLGVLENAHLVQLTEFRRGAQSSPERHIRIIGVHHARGIEKVDAIYGTRNRAEDFPPVFGGTIAQNTPCPANPPTSGSGEFIFNDRHDWQWEDGPRGDVSGLTASRNQAAGHQEQGQCDTLQCLRPTYEIQVLVIHNHNFIDTLIYWIEALSSRTIRLSASTPTSESLRNRHTQVTAGLHEFVFQESSGQVLVFTLNEHARFNRLSERPIILPPSALWAP